MKIAEAFRSVWWICPDCEIDNSTVIDNPLLHIGICCTSCKSVWNLSNLYRKYFDDNSVSLKDKLFFGSVEWICECSRKNIILPRIKCVKDSSTDEEWQKQNEVTLHEIENPEYGL